MKTIQFFFLLILLIPTYLFSQGKVARITYESYNADDTEWTLNSEQTWAYDDQDREIISTSWTSYQGAFAPYNNTRTETNYNSNGSLNFRKNRSWGDTLWQENVTDYIYDAQQALKETLVKQENSATTTIYFQKDVFIENLAENSRTKKYFTTQNTPENWILDHQRDSFLDENDCLLKQTILNFDELGNRTIERWTTTTYAEDCQMLTSGYWLWDSQLDSMYLSSRHNFTYSNNGKTQTDIYEQFHSGSNEWQTKHLVEKEVDDQNREIRYFYVSYSGLPDTIMRVTTYTPEDEIATFKEYRTTHSINDAISFSQIRSDSFIYHYNEEQKLILKEEFIQHYTNPIRKISTHYEYYCNGQLKRELREELPQISKTNYEYYGTADCLLKEDEQPFFEISPNPSDGNIKIKSNLLATENAKIQIFSITGKEVFSKKINTVGTVELINLPHLAAGTYILSFQNSQEILSEKIVIN